MLDPQNRTFLYCWNKISTALDENIERVSVLMVKNKICYTQLLSSIYHMLPYKQ